MVCRLVSLPAMLAPVLAVVEREAVFIRGLASDKL